MASTDFNYPTLESRQRVFRWHEENRERYQQFLEGFNRLSIKNMGFMERIWKLVNDSIPEEFTQLISCLFSSEDESCPELIEQYDGMVGDCLEGRVNICVNLLSGEIAGLPVSEKCEPKEDEAVISAKELKFGLRGCRKRRGRTLPTFIYMPCCWHRSFCRTCWRKDRSRRTVCPIAFTISSPLTTACCSSSPSSVS